MAVLQKKEVDMRSININAFLLTLLCVSYVVFSQPLLFLNFVPFGARAFLEAAPYTLLLIGLHRRSQTAVGLLLIWIILEAVTAVFGPSELKKFVGDFSKIVFFLMLIPVICQSSAALNYFRRFWVGFWTFVALSTILTFVCYQFNLVEFHYLQFGDINAKAAYEYYNNLYLGNIRTHNFFGAVLPKVSWYFNEAGPLSFFFGFNYLVAGRIVTLERNQARFKFLNLIAGFQTLSITFVMFFVLFEGLRLFDKIVGRQKWLLYPASLLVLLGLGAALWLNQDILVYSSADDRSIRLDIALQMLRDDSLANFLFGNGIDITSKLFDRGITVGILSVLIERGVMILGFVVFLLYRYTRPQWMLFWYLIYYNLSFEFFWFPIFWLGIAIVYALSTQSPRRHLDKHAPMFSESQLIV
jgi:hypothetical protein